MNSHCKNNIIKGLELTYKYVDGYNAPINVMVSWLLYSYQCYCVMIIMLLSVSLCHDYYAPINVMVSWL